MPKIVANLVPTQNHNLSWVTKMLLYVKLRLACEHCSANFCETAIELTQLYILLRLWIFALFNNPCDEVNTEKQFMVYTLFNPIICIASCYYAEYYYLRPYGARNATKIRMRDFDW